ncbi:hypothetical protein CLS_17100 [[Clostridium] cf. saccharolyticum K10]|nr:hypothetical protein CLS_17100 [[Clostridium] cf. saccharolyticum K10]
MGRILKIFHSSSLAWRFLACLAEENTVFA